MKVTTPYNPKKASQPAKEEKSPEVLVVQLNFPKRERRPSDILNYKQTDLVE